MSLTQEKIFSDKSKYKLGGVVSVVSHQLKTPLSAIKGYLEVLISEDIGNVNVKQKEYLEDALQNTYRMLGLVKDFLDVSRIEQGKMELNLKWSSLKKVIEETIKEFFFLARARNCTISFKTFGKIPLLNIDALKIKQVVTNIISNAIQYNQGKGEVEVSIKREKNNVIFICKDNGVGIAKDEKNKIFTKFYRSEIASYLSTEGTGLGLFISKSIIEKNGGRIWFTAKKGEGSTFYFSLPIKKRLKHANTNKKG